MERRRLGASDLEVTTVGFGAWAIGGLMWGGADVAAAEDAVRTSLDAGVNLVDTAPAYGCGRSEEIVGRALRGRRHEVVIATKCGLRWDRPGGALRFEVEDPGSGRRVRVYHDLRPGSLREECEASLRRLGVEVIDLYQVHWTYPPHPLEDALEELGRLREQGKVRWLGLCNASPAELEAAVDLPGLACAQSPLNLTDRRVVDSGLLDACRRRGLGFLAYSPMARGLLTGAVTPDRSFPSSDHRERNAAFARQGRERVAAAIARTRPIARRHGASPGNLAVAWVLRVAGVTSALVGARAAAQARENARAASVALSPDEWTELDAAFPRLPWAPSRPPSEER